MHVQQLYGTNSVVKFELADINLIAKGKSVNLKSIRGVMSLGRWPRWAEVVISGKMVTDEAGSNLKHSKKTMKKEGLAG